MNSEVLLENYKMCARENWGQSKDKTDMFKGNENANAKKNKKITINSDHSSNNNM